jgi:thiosulfate dehydrogenase [quinone] large subunit
MSSTTRLNLGLLLARLPLGLLFFLAGLAKITGGVASFVSESAKTVPSYVPPVLGRGYLYALPFVELITGAMIVLGLFTRVNALIQVLILFSIILALGVEGVLRTNIVLLGLAMLLALVGAGDFSVDRMMGRKGKSSAPR